MSSNLTVIRCVVRFVRHVNLYFMLLIVSFIRAILIETLTNYVSMIHQQEKTKHEHMDFDFNQIVFSCEILWETHFGRCFIIKYKSNRYCHIKMHIGVIGLMSFIPYVVHISLARILVFSHSVDWRSIAGTSEPKNIA